MGSDYTLTQKFLDMLGVKHIDEVDEKVKTIMITSIGNTAVMFVFDKDGIYQYLG